VRYSDGFVHLIDRVTQAVYTLSGGRLGTTQLGWTVLLLTTVGRRTGRLRRHTLVYLRDGERLLLVGSNNGGDHHPAWYHNLLANPRVLVQEGRRKAEYIASTAAGEERAALWAKLVAYHPPYADHQSHTARTLPVVVLTPAAHISAEAERAALSAGGSEG
jgi:deazaflavin-dependent oxidoreductase (nitroreductase family)